MSAYGGVLVTDEKPGKDFLYVGLFNAAVLSDEELLEESLVEQLPLGRCGGRVLLVTTPRNGQRPLKLLFQLLQALEHIIELILGRLYFSLQSLHFLFQ